MCPAEDCSEGVTMAAIGVGEMYRGAFTVLRRHWRWTGIATLCWLTFMVGFAAWWLYYNPFGLFLIYIWPELLIESSSAAHYFLEEFLFAVASNAISAVFIVIVLRVFLMGNPLGEMSRLADLITAMFHVFLFDMLLRVTFLAGAIAIGRPWEPEVLEPEIGRDLLEAVVLIAVSGIVLALFCMIYVSAALGLGWRIRKNVRLTRQVSGRLFLAFAILWVMTSVVFDLVDTSVVSGSTIGHDDDFRNLAWIVVRSAEDIIRFVVFLALIATAFAKLTGSGLAGMPDGARSPEEIARTFD